MNPWSLSRSFPDKMTPAWCSRLPGMRIARSGLYALGMTVLLCSCAAPKFEDIEPGAKPPLDTPEAGLWLRMDKAERSLRSSGAILDDPELTSYLQGIACNLAPEYCSDIRVYVFDIPEFNATMAPNGMMSVWTGLLLRVENEAQLAAVLGHELGHYIRRHSLSRWISARRTLDMTAFLQVGTAIAGYGIGGDVAGLMAVGHIMAYGREHEREADRHGLELMIGAGYDPSEAAMVWENLIAEREAADKKDGPIFFASHPPSDERMNTLRQQAAMAEVGAGGKGDGPFRRALQKHRLKWLQDDIQLRRFARSKILLDRIGEAGADPGMMEYLNGEFYRLRAEPGDLELARDHYAKCIGLRDVPVDMYRSLGLIHWSLGDHAQAYASLETYLEKSESPTDRAMIESYMKELSR